MSQRQWNYLKEWGTARNRVPTMDDLVAELCWRDEWFMNPVAKLADRWGVERIVLETIEYAEANKHLIETEKCLNCGEPAYMTDAMSMSWCHRCWEYAAENDGELPDLRDTLS